MKDNIQRAARHLRSVIRFDHRVPMWVRLSSLVLALALAGSVGLGMPLHSSDRGCNMPMEMEGCDMGMPTAPGMTPTALCCLLNCQEQGPTSSSFSVQTPSFSAASAHQIAPPPVDVPKPLPQARWMQSSSFTPPDTYLKNLALLI